MIPEFLRELTHEGYRVFSKEDAKELGHSIGLEERSVAYILHLLTKQKMIRSLWRGNYAIEDNILAGAPLHKFEIAMHLAPGGAIGYWSAMTHYGLSDQVLSKMFIVLLYDASPKRSIKKYFIDGYEYLLIEVPSQNFWGIEKIKAGETKIQITTLERTLLDGLSRPHYCGGFREVMSAFQIARPRIDLDLLISYAKKCPISTQKRLGWMLEYMGFHEVQKKLDLSLSTSIDKLDVGGPRRGTYNKTWMILENY